MKARNHISIIVFLLTGITAMAQVDTTFRLARRLNGDIVSFAVDNLDNIYLVNSTNQLKKLNEKGDSVAVFNDVKRYGQATLIDVSNPLKVLLYYKDFATIVVLDRLLNVRNTIDLRKQNILQVRAVSQSYDGNIWVYDELESKLKKIDDEGNLLLETPDFRQLFDKVPQPQMIFDQDQLVYLYDSTQAVYVFDYYGAFKNKVPVERWQNFRVIGNYFFGTKGNILYRYEVKTFRTDEWQLTPSLSRAIAFHIRNNRVYALRRDGLDIFEFR